MKSKASNTTQQVTQIMDYLRTIFKAIRDSSSQFEKQVGLSAAQVFVLRQLNLESELSINDLADKTKTHQSSVSVVVKKLEERGLVLRKVAETDSRRFQISLSESGREVLQKLPVSVQEHLIEAISRMSDEDRERLGGLMQALVRDAGLLHDEPVAMMDDH